MRQPNWDKYEVALLIEAYWKIKEDKSQKNAIVKKLSSFLRSRPTYTIDATFRNENGIRMRLEELERLFSSERKGLKNTSELFREMVALYQQNQAKFNRILKQAKGSSSYSLSDDSLKECDTKHKKPNSQKEASVLVLKEKSDSSRTKPFETLFFRWLREYKGIESNICSRYLVSLHNSEKFARENGTENAKLCTMDASLSLATADFLLSLDAFEPINQKNPVSFYEVFSKLKEFFLEYSNDQVAVIVPLTNTSSEVNKTSRQSIQEILTKDMDKCLKESLEGIAKKELRERFRDYSMHQINSALVACHSVLVLDRYYHRDNLSDYEQMAEVLLDVITKQFSTNGNYTSAKLLYDEAKPRLDDFFFYNNAFNSRTEVYDLAVHLFEQEQYKGNSFVFWNSMHIWKDEPDYSKDYHGLLIKYAKEHGNIFTRDDAEDYFRWIGSTSPSATFSNMIFSTGRRTFLQFAENRFVLAEALHINDYFLSSVDIQVRNLLDGDDYIAIGEIDDFFYMTLPSLPDNVSWSPLLLEDLFRIYETDYTTFDAGQENDKKTYPAAIVRKKSHYKSFGDLVWNEVSLSFQLPKEFSSSEFRAFLLEKGFIRGMEKMWSVHKTVTGDIRFYWTENYGKVTIN